MSTARTKANPPVKWAVGILVFLLINLGVGLVTDAFSTQITGRAQLFVWIGSLLTAILISQSV